MEGKDILSIVLAVSGLVILFVSLGADLLGGWPGFGLYQITGGVLGVALIWVAWLFTPKKS